MSDSTGSSAFAGTWLLQPERCRYELGLPPRGGEYTIRYGADAALEIDWQWISATGRAHRIAFTGRLDGQPHPYTSTSLADALRFEQISATQLRSSGWRQGVKVMWAERTLLAADTLEIQVHGFLAGGGVYTNTDVFVRKPR